MKTSILALAVALSTAGTAALAADNTVTLSYGAFEKDNVESNGLVYDFEGQAGGFGYEGFVFDGNTEDVDTRVAGAKLDWTGYGIRNWGVGPVLGYNYLNIGGEDIDGFSGGIAAKGVIGRTEVKADALVSFDDKEFWAVGVDTETMLTEKTTLLADYTYTKADSEESQLLGLGARYDLTQTTYLEGQAIVEHSFSETGAGARVGVGFRF